MAQASAKGKEIVKYGPYGSELQENYSFQLSEGECIIGVKARTGDIVDNYGFVIANSDGHHRTVSFGGPGGDDGEEVILDPGDYLTGVSGIYGDYLGLVVIGTLTIYSRFSPKGLITVGKGKNLSNPTTFSSPSPSPGTMVGVFGRANEYVESIGVFINKEFQACD